MSKFTSAFANYFEGFLQYKESHGHTRKSYLRLLEQFDQYCAAKYPNTAELTKDCVLGWIQKRPKESSDSFGRRTRLVRQLGEYMTLMSVPAYILPHKLGSGKSEFTPYLFTDHELKMFFHAADHIAPSPQNPFRAAVVPVIFRLIYTCGLRPGEGRCVKRSNINFQTGEILIEGKKKHKQRIVVMSDDMLKLCLQYDKKRSVLFSGSDWFFPDPSGNPYTSQWLLKIFKNCWKNAHATYSIQCAPNVRVYDLRHRFATAVIHKWTSEGKNVSAMLPYLRTYMGHEHFNETLYYIHLLPENLACIVEQDTLTSIIPEVDYE